MSDRIPCRVSAELRAYMREQEEQYATKDLPDFRQYEDAKAVTDAELAPPIASLMNAKDQYLKCTNRAIKEELVEDMLRAISALERGLLARWLDL